MRLHIKDRMNYLVDNIVNFRKYRAMKKTANRDWFKDMNKLNGDEKMEFMISDDGERNRLIINGITVLDMTFGETAMFYRFMKKCIYK